LILPHPCPSPGNGEGCKTLKSMTPISEMYNEDCLVGMRQFPDKFFDIAIVDPQYGINAPKMSMGTHKTRHKDGYPGESVAAKLRKGRLNAGGGKLKNRNLQTMPINWDNEPPSAEYFLELFRVSKNQIIWGGNYFDLPPTRGIIAWDKKQPWENFSQFELAWTSFDCPAKLFSFSNRGGNNKLKKIHPTQKPIELYEYCYQKFVKPDFKVLDTHVGSQSHRIVAYRNGIDFWGFEIDPMYFEGGNEWFNKEISHL
jgi:site-specific DNA-methyltransferase (adenine-specific)